MARITWSPGVTPFYRSIGGTCFQSNKHGSTVKKKPTIVFPARTKQRNIINNFSIVLRLYNTLSSANKISWNDFAYYDPQYSTKPPYNILSGFSIFCRINLLRFNAGLSFLISPSDFTWETTTFTISFTRPGGVYYLNIIPALSDYTLYLSVYLSKLTSATGQPASQSFRYMFTTLNFVQSVNIENFLLDILGALPQSGFTFCIMLRIFGIDNGALFPTQYYFSSIP